MRTTISLPDQVLRAARRRAAARGISLSALVAEALRAELDERAPAARPFVLVTWGQGGVLPGIDLDRSSALLDLDDANEIAARR